MSGAPVFRVTFVFHVDGYIVPSYHIATGSMQTNWIHNSGEASWIVEAHYDAWEPKFHKWRTAIRLFTKT
jgi:hypothetical protein